MTFLDDACLRVTRFADGERMFRRTEKVLVAVSGGADSTACLLVLRKLRAQYGFDLAACHFDHQLRESSAADMQRVRELCDQLGVDCFTGEGDVRTVAREQRQGLESTARTMRYQFLAFVAGKEHADAIATGHTRDDQAETVLMRVIRGAGVRGIRGMLPVAPVPGSEAQRLVRPLLVLTRAETAAVCREAGIEPLMDPSNADPAFTRNRVRIRTLEALRDVNPSVDRALVGLAESAREAFAGIEKAVLALAPAQRGPAGAIFPTAAVESLPNEALTLVLEREAAFYQLAPEVNRTRLENLRTVLSHGTGKVRFAEAEVEASCGQVRIGPVLEANDGPFQATVLNVPGSTRAGPWRVDVATEPSDLAGEPVLVVPSAAVSGALRARPLRPGDRMRFRGIERKVADVLAATRTPAWERSGMVAIADSHGVLGVFGPGGAIADATTSGDAFYIRLVQLPSR